jgi:aromatic ring-opening dioxygenase LigB subunit
MKKLLLLDAVVVIDLHALRLFDKIANAYDVIVTRKVLEEAKHYKKGNIKVPIDIKDEVTIIEKVSVECLQKVTAEAKEARLMIDSGEATSIAYLLQSEEEMTFCTCDAAAIKCISYMELDDKSSSLEAVLESSGHHRKLYPRHFKSKFKQYVNEGKALRIQFKKLT